MIAGGEFDLIRRCFDGRGTRRSDVLLGIGDDCAILRVPAGQQAWSAIYGLNAPAGTALPGDGRCFGHLALARALNRLAALGAEPSWATLALSMPVSDGDWLDAFAGGFLDLASRHGVQLVGGDTTRGPTCATVVAHGFTTLQGALDHRGARPDDRIFLARPAPASESGAEPEDPLIAVGLALRGIASAAFDPDGDVAANLAALTAVSNVGIEIDDAHGAGDARRGLALCFTVAPARLAALSRASAGLNVELVESAAPAPSLDYASSPMTARPAPGHDRPLVPSRGIVQHPRVTSAPVTAPGTEAELMRRARDIAGFTLSQLAGASGRPVPRDPRTAKGWAGQLLEHVLGATAGSLSEPDFQLIGVEMKTIPIGATGQPLESTYVCTVPLTGDGQPTWVHSNVRRKLARVLWIPVEAERSLAIGERHVGSPVLWSPSDQEESGLRADWEELTDMVHLGELEQITAHHGTWLQIRPKAADSHARRWAVGEDGAPVRTNPRGFYLRPTFTAEILRRHFQRPD